jgi:hypothetical protein
MHEVVKVLLILFFAANVALQAHYVGKARKPLTTGEATFGAVVNLLIVVAVIAWV